ncbi:hypothetical protein [Glutamicibacter sp.]|uniref:hypothetical protein n=1 Tax=Glutamicibacter sp. TaxID=1931995 RepID=UPI002B46E6CB|nr:hypothetical protein [Glutamicibacter sp.]HJX76797.1 hypothetical protein [Glutamicibacter sp.]
MSIASLSIGVCGGFHAIHALGGRLGLLTAFQTWCGSAAVVINAPWKRSVLPAWA